VRPQGCQRQTNATFSASADCLTVPCKAVAPAPTAAWLEVGANAAADTSAAAAANNFTGLRMMTSIMPVYNENDSVRLEFAPIAAEIRATDCH
jgi:hypothetical protein